MARREGSRYDDLTPREQEVLLLIRDGHDEEAIAERLGIVLGAVHYHEANLFAKLGVSTREAAAAWEPSDEAPAPDMSNVRDVEFEAEETPGSGAPASDMLTPDAGAGVRVSMDGKPDRAPSMRAGATLLAAAAVVILAIAGGGLIGSLGSGSGESEGPLVGNPGGPAVLRTMSVQRPTESPAPRPPLPPTPEPLGPPLVVTEDTGIPFDLALILVDQCVRCSRVGEGFVSRVYVSADGTMREEKLFDPKEYFPDAEHSAIWYMAFAPGGNEILLAVCAPPACEHGTGGPVIGQPDEDSGPILIRSQDGGVTWEEAGVLPWHESLVGSVDGEFLVSSYILNVPTDELSEQSYYLWPSGEAVPRPANDEWQYFTPMPDGAGGLYWYDGTSNLYDRDGIWLLTLPGILAVIADPADENALFVRWQAHQGVSPRGYISRFTRSEGEDKLTEWSTYQVTDLSGLYPVVGLRGHILAGNYYRFTGDRSVAHWRPAIIEYKFGEVWLIAPPDGSGEGWGVIDRARHLAAVQVGPFARVTADGLCVNVRESYGIESPVVECVTDGVLLRHEGALVPGTDGEGNPAPALGGTDWLQVVTPAGNRGFASTEFLEF